MKVMIELRSGHNTSDVTKRDIQKNIDACQRCIDRRQNCSDDVILINTKSILEGIKSQLPEEG